MEAYTDAVMHVLAIYIEQIGELSEKDEKVCFLMGLMDYLSTAPVKAVLRTPQFSGFREILLRKIDEFADSDYVLDRCKEYHRFYAVLNELNCYLSDKKEEQRRSERQKQRAVRRFNMRFEGHNSPYCMQIAKELKSWSAVPPTTIQPATIQPATNIKVKVLPRRSLRLMRE